MALHLVTGGAGFIGSSIAEALLSAGDTVRILDDFSSGRRERRLVFAASSSAYGEGLKRTLEAFRARSA